MENKKNKKINEDIKEEINEEIKDKKIKGTLMSAVEYAVSQGKSIAVAKILPILDKIYKEDHFKEDWDLVFEACKTKPANLAWDKHLKNIKGRKE